MSSPFFYDPSFLHILAPYSIFVFYLFLAHFSPRFPSTSPPPLYPFSPLHCFIFISSPPLFPLTRFLPSSLLVHSLCFYIPLLLLVVLGSVHQAYWHMLVVDEFCHDYTHTHARHMPMCLYAQTCWRWWLMSNARLSASVPIRAAQETSLGLLSAAWYWLRYSPTRFFFLFLP